MLLILIWFIFSSLELTHCNINNFKLDIEETSTFQGFFVRKLTSDKLYFGNISNDYIYSLSTNIITTQSTKSICAVGTACPAIFFDTTENNIIKVSKQNAHLEISDNNNLLYFNLSIGSNMMGVLYLSVGCFSVGTQTSSDAITEQAERTFYIFNVDGSLIGSIPIVTHNFGIIAISLKKLLAFKYYSFLGSKFYYAYYNVNNLTLIDDWKEIQNIYRDKVFNYYQIIKVSSSYIIGCALTENKNAIICFSGDYGDSTSFAITKGFTIVINSCQVSEGFSFANLDNDTAIVSCGINELKIAIFDINLDPSDNIIIISQQEYTFLDFMVYNSNRLYIIMSQLNQDTGYYAYYADFLILGEIRSDSSEIEKFKPFPIMSLFPITFSFKIMITEASSISEIYSNDTPASMNTPYYVDTLWYKPNVSRTFKLKYALSLFDSDIVSISSQKEFEYTFITCSLGCESCKLPRSENNDNCISCDISNDFYASEITYLDDQLNTLYNCYKGNVPGYYLDKKKFPYLYKQCYETCETCKNKGNSTVHNCLTCKSGYFQIEDKLGNCENEFTLSSIVSNHSYVFDVETSTYKKCAFSCKTCTKPPSNGNEYCFDCKEGFILNPLNNNNCIFECEFKKFFINYEDNQYICTSDENCPSTHPLLVIDSNQCVTSCLNTYNCPYCSDNYPLYEFNGTCVKSCPSGLSFKNFKCIEKRNFLNEPIDNGNTSLISLSRSITSDYFKENIDTALNSCFLNNDKPITSMQGSNYNFNFYSSEISKETVLSNDLPYIDLQQCETKLRETYNIPQNEKLFIGQMVYDSTALSSSASNQLQYEIYREKDQTKLDLTSCNEIPISITKPLTNVEGIDFNIAKELKDKGIDVFNKDDPIFNDRCTTLSLNGKDVSMTTRQEEIYAGIELCDKGCNVKEMNYTSKVVECECEPQKEGFDSKIEESEILGMFNDYLSSTNFELFLCYLNIQKAFSQQKFIKNYGNVMLIAVFCFVFILNIVFYKCQIHNIYFELNRYFPSSPPPHDYNNNNGHNNQKNKEIHRTQRISQSNNFLIKSQQKRKLYRHTVNSISSNEKDKERSESKMLRNHSNKSKTISKVTQKKHPYNNEGIFFYPNIDSSNNKESNNILKDNSSFSNKMHHKSLVNNNKKPNISKTIYTSSLCISINETNTNSKEFIPSHTMLNQLSYREACRQDNRSFCEYYICILKEKQIILSTILNKSIFYPLSLRISILLFTLSSFFFINALLFTEDFITKRYNTSENLGFVYMLQNELGKSMYSSIIGMFIGKFINMILSSETHFIKLYQSERNYTYLIKFKNLVSDMKKKFIIVIIVTTILTLVYWYFITVFCYIYQNNQKSWIESSLFSIGLNIIIPITLCFVIATLRNIGLKFQCGLIFNISVCVYYII